MMCRDVSLACKRLARVMFVFRFALHVHIHVSGLRSRFHGMTYGDVMMNSFVFSHEYADM